MHVTYSASGQKVDVSKKFTCALFAELNKPFRNCAAGHIIVL